MGAAVCWEALGAQLPLPGFMLLTCSLTGSAMQAEVVCAGWCLSCPTPALLVALPLESSHLGVNRDLISTIRCTSFGCQLGAGCWGRSAKQDLVKVTVGTDTPLNKVILKFQVL